MLGVWCGRGGGGVLAFGSNLYSCRFFPGDSFQNIDESQRLGGTRKSGETFLEERTNRKVEGSVELDAGWGGVLLTSLRMNRFCLLLLPPHLQIPGWLRFQVFSL